MSDILLRPRPVAALREAAARFGGDAGAGKASLLSECARTFGADARRVPDARSLVGYHDLLLFLLAYPDSEAVALAAERELSRIAALARRVDAQGSDRQRERLAGSGIAWSTTTATFSLPIVRWLVRRYPRSCDLDSFASDGAALAGVLALALPKIDAEALATGSDDALALVGELAGGQAGNHLAWLARTLDAIKAPSDVREYLFESVRAFVRITAKRTRLCTTFARGLPQPRYVHAQPLERTVADPVRAIREPISPPRALSPREQSELIDTARSVLAMLSRETDPITWPSRSGVSYFELPHGAAVALYPTAPARRFALDTHTGYLLFKNRVPIAYGGGWPFLRTCKTGINVFAPFRGGESALLFAHVLNVYQQRFGVKRFVVEPYQFGAGNREGLRSGAFWFYYRLGFRPVDTAGAEIARAEFARIGATKGYRSPLATMRTLAGGDLALDIEPIGTAEATEPADIARAVSRWIAAEHRGERTRATVAALRRARAALDVRDDASWPAAERAAFRSLCLAVALIEDLARWPPDEKRALVELMRAKGRPDDADYFVRLNAHHRLRHALARIAKEK